MHVAYLGPMIRHFSYRFRTSLSEREHTKRCCSALRSSKLFSNQAPLGVYLVDADFRIREVNPVALPVFGDIPGGVIGRDFSEIIHILWVKEYADEIVQIFRRTLETGEAHVAADSSGLRADRGIAENYEWRADRISLPDGRYGVVSYFRDISERKRGY